MSHYVTKVPAFVKRLVRKEVWRDVKGYKGLYQVSTWGRAKSLNRWGGHNYRQFRPERLLKPVLGTEYLLIGLCKNNQVRLRPLHKIIAETFLPNTYNKPQVNHKDGNKLNNRLDNLEWATALENTRHAVATGLLKVKGEDNPASKLTDEGVKEIFRLRFSKQSAKDIGSRYAIDPTGVYDIWMGKRWRHVTGAKRGNRDWLGVRERGKRGQDNGRATVTDKQVVRIRQLRATGKYTRQQLADMFNTSLPVIKRIVNYKSWRHLP